MTKRLDEVKDEILKIADKHQVDLHVRIDVLKKHDVVVSIRSIMYFSLVSWFLGCITGLILTWIRLT